MWCVARQTLPLFGTTSPVLVLQEIHRSACAFTHGAGGTETLGAALNDVKASRRLRVVDVGVDTIALFLVSSPHAPQILNRRAAVAV